MPRELPEVPLNWSDAELQATVEWLTSECGVARDELGGLLEEHPRLLTAGRADGAKSRALLKRMLF